MNNNMNNNSSNNMRTFDQICGSLIGGAVGDALGYAVEFDSEKRIFGTYGPQGITDYELTRGLALISDDTQMTLFTAEGLLARDAETADDARDAEAGEAAEDSRDAETVAAVKHGSTIMPRVFVKKAYENWYLTQHISYEKSKCLEKSKDSEETSEIYKSQLLNVPELFQCRAPGGTCLSALQKSIHSNRNDDSFKDLIFNHQDLSKDQSLCEAQYLCKDYIAQPVNRSKGCGGIMRVAPVALRYRQGNKVFASLEALDLETAQIAGITHGHSLGYMPAATISHILGKILMNDGSSLKDIVIDARDTMSKIFKGDRHLDELIDIINLAIELSENDQPDLDNIHRLGEGWVAEETLGIALYCSLKYSHDFSAAVIAAVNHKGDSDSTGAVTGNIVGAIVGYEAIEEKWKKHLELHDVILKMADALVG